MVWLLVALLASGLHDDADFKAATDLYRELEYEQAMLTFERLSVAPGITPAERVEVLLWASLCSAGLGDVASAERWMKEALARDAAASFPVKAPPAMSERLEQLRAARAPPPAASSPRTDAVIHASAAPEETWDLLPVALGAGAAVAWVGTGVLAFVAAGAFERSQDTSLFVDERVAQHGAYLGTLTGSIALGVAGAGLGAAAGALSFTRSEP